MTTFKKAALKYFADEVPAQYTQRIDGIECFSDLSRFVLWRFRLRILAWQGLIRMNRHRSIWASMNGMVGYGQAKTNTDNENGE